MTTDMDKLKEQMLQRDREIVIQLKMVGIRLAQAYQHLQLNHSVRAFQEVDEALRMLDDLSTQIEGSTRELRR